MYVSVLLDASAPRFPVLGLLRSKGGHEKIKQLLVSREFTRPKSVHA